MQQFQETIQNVTAALKFSHWNLIIDNQILKINIFTKKKGGKANKPTEKVRFKYRPPSVVACVSGKIKKKKVFSGSKKCI